MGIGRIGSPVDIAVSGLRAQALRMNVVAGNIANSNTSRTESGQPYRRREVVISSIDGSGVSDGKIVEDFASDFKNAYMPGHPDADASGMVTLPNVDLPAEMVNLVAASRAYQANAAVLKRYQDMVDVTVELLR